ncbi:GNAT family N-acetyltransferase [Aquimarina mytili]|uniref:GNAT family N-acetyltransferase n=1 Tax=Aquimarina mytili TaxID=874423 RepID=A0A936ZXG3_9FLAO|nr:N-acetyltransferase [Aquimarina mytili]MBL0683738.1 GNAT family N-acetyltransferase [Aquimarina mytili]
MYTIRPAIQSDEPHILALYKKVAQQSGGIIRVTNEITLEYIRDFVSKSIQDGIILVTVNPDDNQIIAEIHAYRIGLSAFRHILTDLTIVVAPDFQGQKIGKTLFNQFLETIESEYPHILRVELFVRENNKNTIQFYSRLGFINEGRQHQKIKNLDHSLETPIHMAWFNSNYNTAL